MNQVATTRGKPAPQAIEVADLRRQLTTMEGEFEAVLPRGVRVDEFKRVVLNAVQERPELLAADQPSFFRACLDCARDGLVPDGKEAFFDIRNTKVKLRGQGEAWIQKVVYMPMVRGFYKRAVGPNKPLKDWRADVVCENDDWDLVKGDEERFYHKPNIFGDRGKILGAYSIAVRHDGTISREFMGYGELMKAKAKSPSGNGPNSPWIVWEPSMCIKTVVKRHGPRLNLGDEAMELIDKDNIIAIAPVEPAKPAVTASRKATSQLAAIAKPVQEPQEAEEDEGDQQEPEAQQPAQRAQEAAQQPGKRGPGRPTNAEREAAQQASQEALQEERAKRAQPAAAKQAAPASAKSQPRLDTSPQEAGQQGTTTPRNGGAKTASRSEPEREKGSHISGDPVDDIPETMEDPKQIAYQQGWAAFHAELDRKPPRQLTAANRYDELDAWYSGYDAAAEDAEKGEHAESDQYVDQVYS